MTHIHFRVPPPARSSTVPLSIHISDEEKARILQEVRRILQAHVYNLAPQKLRNEVKALEEYLQVYQYKAVKGSFELAELPLRPVNRHQYQRHEKSQDFVRGDGHLQEKRLGTIQPRHSTYWLAWFHIVGLAPSLRSGKLAYKLRLRPYKDAEWVPVYPTAPALAEQAATTFRFPPSYRQWQLLTPLHRSSETSEQTRIPQEGSPIGGAEKERLYEAVSWELRSERWRSPDELQLHFDPSELGNLRLSPALKV